MNIRLFGRPRRQRGTVLVISLVILLAMTLIGVTALQTTVLEEKMSGNLKDQNAAFQASEAGLRETMDWIESNTRHSTGMPLANSSGSNGVWTECSINYAIPEEEEEAVCNAPATGCGNGTTAISITGIDHCGGEFGSFMSDVNTSDMQTTVSSLPRIIVEERYAPPPEFEAAVLKKGVIHYTQSSAGYGFTSQARSQVQSTVPIQRL